MNRILCAAAAVMACCGLLIFSGCGPSPEEEVAGTYVLDKEAIKAAARAEIEGEEDPMEKMGMEMVMGLIDQMNMSLTLNADGTATRSATIMGETETGSGTWTRSGDTITLAMAEEGQTPDTATARLTDEGLELEAEEGEDMPAEKMLFRKQ